MSAAGWYRDPTGKFSIRYWDGQQWTSTVNSGGSNTSDPIPDEMRYVQPAPGTEAAAARPVQPTTQVTQQSSGASGGTIVAVVLSVIAVLLVLLVLLNQDRDTDTTEPPATTEAPATTAPPANE